MTSKGGIYSYRYRGSSSSAPLSDNVVPNPDRFIASTSGVPDAPAVNGDRGIVEGIDTTGTGEKKLAETG